MSGAVLVTGGGRRIGRAIAEALAADGRFVALHYNASDEEAEAAAAAIRNAGGEAAAVRGDLSDIGETGRLVEAAAAAAARPLDALVNNASLFAYDDPASFSADSFERHQTINLTAPAILARDFAAQVPAGGEGTVVNLLDQKLYNLNPDFFSYTISKFGLLGLTQTLAVAWREPRDDGARLRIAGVAPGLVLPSANMTAASFERMHRATPLGRGADPADLVRAVRFILATPGFHGQVLTIDGGESLVWRANDIGVGAAP